MAPIQQDLYKGGQWTFDHYCHSMISAAATRWVLDQVDVCLVLRETTSEEDQIGQACSKRNRTISSSHIFFGAYLPRRVVMEKCSLTNLNHNQTSFNINFI